MKNRRITQMTAILLIAAGGLALTFLAGCDKEPIQRVNTGVLDLTGTLNNEQLADLSAPLVELGDEGGPAISILLIRGDKNGNSSSLGDDIFMQWTKDKKGDYILCLVTIEEQRVFYYCSRTVGNLNRFNRDRISKYEVVPLLKQNQVKEAITLLAQKTIAGVRGNYHRKPESFLESCELYVNKLRSLDRYEVPEDWIFILIALWFLTSHINTGRIRKKRKQETIKHLKLKKGLLLGACAAAIISTAVIKERMGYQWSSHHMYLVYVIAGAILFASTFHLNMLIYRTGYCDFTALVRITLARLCAAASTFLLAWAIFGLSFAIIASVSGIFGIEGLAWIWLFFGFDGGGRDSDIGSSTDIETGGGGGFGGRSTSL